MTSDIFQRPALDFLLRLEREGVDLVAIDGRLLFARPFERLSLADREALRAFKSDLLPLLRIVDDAVQRRREVFASQLSAHG